MNIRIGSIGRLLAPGYSQCGRCRTPWRFVTPHTTQYADASGCFPLCGRCWTELGTADARMPFYRALWEQWVHDRPAHWSFSAYARLIEPVVPWATIEAAVYREAATLETGTWVFFWRDGPRQGYVHHLDGDSVYVQEQPGGIVCVPREGVTSVEGEA